MNHVFQMCWEFQHWLYRQCIGTEFQAQQLHWQSKAMHDRSNDTVLLSCLGILINLFVCSMSVVSSGLEIRALQNLILVSKSHMSYALKISELCFKALNHLPLFRELLILSCRFTGRRSTVRPTVEELGILPTTPAAWEPMLQDSHASNKS